MQKGPQCSGKSMERVEHQYDCVLDTLIVAWQFVEGSYKHFVEGVEDVFVDEIVVCEVDDC